jgi:hypothetical protein
MPDSYCNCRFSGLVPTFQSQKSQEDLKLLVTEERYWALFYMPLYKLLQNFPNALVQNANKTRLQKEFYKSWCAVTGKN